MTRLKVRQLIGIGALLFAVFWLTVFFTERSRTAEPAPRLSIPRDDPPIEPKKNALRCASTARLTLAKQYGESGDRNVFLSATRLNQADWKIRGELHAYKGDSFTIYPYECIDSDEATGVQIGRAKPGQRN